ncbi:MAG: recombinase RecT [Christensenellales bacterium]|jgi:recombination protein RecT
MATKAKEKTQEVITQEDQKLSNSERFTNMVMAQYNKTGKPYQFTEREMQLIRNYFIKIDQMLTITEGERIRKNANNSDRKYDNNLPYTWGNLDLPQLAQDLAHYARIGLDMMEDNVLFPIPYQDKKRNKYVVTLMEGYNGIKYQAVKYALEPFVGVTVEVIYENDNFKVAKKDSRNQVEGYEMDVTQPFNRGKPIGVFGYIEYENPSKNKLVVFSEADVMKRKPKYAAPEFWGGTKKVWENGRQVETVLEGWIPEMFEKTMKREIYGSKHIPRDPDKIDASYQYIRNREQQYADIAIEAEVEANANAEPVTLPDTEPVNLPEAAEQAGAVQQSFEVKPDKDAEGVPLPWEDEEPSEEAGF